MKKESRKNTYKKLPEKGMTYAQIARECGVSPQAVQGSLNYQYRYKSLGAH